MHSALPLVSYLLFICQIKDTQEFLRVLMDLLHEELKEPVPPSVVKQETSAKKLTNTASPTRLKRLLGGQTMNEELMQSNDLLSISL